MNQSQKHHFLPVFYLKGFTGNNGQFKIFDIEKQDFKKKGKYFSPSSHFYRSKDNTIIGDFGESDFMEKLYEKVDNRFAKILNIINKNSHKNRFGVSEKDMPLINNFVSQIYWRSPYTKEILKDYINIHSNKQLGFNINNQDGSYNEKLSMELKNIPEFYKVYKFYNSLLDSIRGFNCDTQYHIFDRPKELPSICSDFPIIFEENNPTKVYEDDYIFPLSQNRIFVRRNLTQRFNHQLHYLIDLISLKQSVDYVATSDKGYIDYLLKLDNENNCTIEEYKENLFKQLI